jgi:hypothetical protein
MGFAVRYPNPKAGVPRAIWALDNHNTLIVDGQNWHIPTMRNRIAGLVDEIDAGLTQLLKGATPEELGLHLTAGMRIRDDTSNTSTGYCFLDDGQNGFKEVEHALAVHILGHDDGLDFHRGLDNQKRIIWKDQGILDYLELHAAVSNKMALSWHLVGGQPSRGVESSTIQLRNSQHRFRSVLMVNNQLISVVAYNKTGTQVRSDKAVAHCFPWALARQFLVMNALVRPFVCQLTRIKFGPQRHSIQHNSVFATMGKEMSADLLSKLLVTFFEDRMDCRNIGLNAHRHAVIEIQRKLMPAAADPLARALAVVDAQAGHSSDTAALYYGLDSDERRTFLSTTMTKFLLVSMLWWPVVLPAQYLTEVELHGAAGASRQLDRDPGQAAIPAQSADITEATAKLVMD